MDNYVALFRGINVGGRNKLPMDELVQVLKRLGLRKIKTYIQSGNVVFESDNVKESVLSEKLSKAIEASHGFAPQVIILSIEEFNNAIAANPFQEAESNPKSLHLFFLKSEPQDPDWETLEKKKRDSEGYSLINKVFYLHAPDGIGRSKLAQGVEKALGVAATARNWRSVCQIMALANHE